MKSRSLSKLLILIFISSWVYADDPRNQTTKVKVVSGSGTSLFNEALVTNAAPGSTAFGIVTRSAGTGTITGTVNQGNANGGDSAAWPVLLEGTNLLSGHNVPIHINAVGSYNHLRTDDSANGVPGATASTVAGQIGGVDGSGKLIVPKVIGVPIVSTDNGMVTRPLGFSTYSLGARPFGFPTSVQIDDQTWSLHVQTTSGSVTNIRANQGEGGSQEYPLQVGFMTQSENTTRTSIANNAAMNSRGTRDGRIFVQTDHPNKFHCVVDNVTALTECIDGTAIAGTTFITDVSIVNLGAAGNVFVSAYKNSGCASTLQLKVLPTWALPVAGTYEHHFATPINSGKRSICCNSSGVTVGFSCIIEGYQTDI